jgi:peptidoglycan/LPS O-acetylase OafA/YrhL
MRVDSHSIKSTYDRPSVTRLPQLDLLRGIAVLLVIARHLPFGYSYAGQLAPSVKIAFDFGWTGVDLFFVLSGFLVGGLLFKEWQRRSALDIRRFLIRRAFKIWPAYFIYVIAMGILYIWDGSLGPPRQLLTLIFPNLLHLQSYVLTPLPHTWSLSVEEHFYLALPLVLLFVANRRHERRHALKAMLSIGACILILLFGAHYALRSFLPLQSLPTNMQPYVRPYLLPEFLWFVVFQLSSLLVIFVLLPRFWKSNRNDLTALPLVVATVLILCSGFRLWSHSVSADLEIDWTYVFCASHLRIDSLLFGVLLGYFHHFWEQRVRRVASHRTLLCVVGIALVSCAVYNPVPFLTSYYVLGFNLLYVGYGCLLLAVVYTPLGEGWLGKCLASFPARALSFIGCYSYSIYLWHITPFRFRMDQWIYDSLIPGFPIELRWLAITIVSIGGAILLGVLMAKVIEQPFLRLRDRIFPGHADSLVLTAQRQQPAGKHEPAIIRKDRSRIGGERSAEVAFVR